MNAKQLIEKVNECSKNNWKNSDLGRGSEKMLEYLADHFEMCEQCRKDFDAQEYPERTFIEIEERLMVTGINNLICGYDNTVILK